MPVFQFEAMDPQGQEIRDVIEAQTQDEAQATIRSMGYFVTKIALQKTDKQKVKGGKGKSFAIGGAGGKKMVQFTRQLSILQDAGLPILRSLQILQDQSRPGALKNALIDVCDEIQGGSSLSEAMNKVPKVFDRLYVNMIKAGEAGGALELILQRLAEFKEFEIDLPEITKLLMAVSDRCVKLWFLFPLVPITIVLFIALVCKFRAGRMGWHIYLIKVPVFGKLMEKSNLARTTRTLGALVASGVPILESLSITRETSGNAMYEKVYTKVTDSIREGETISRPLKRYAIPSFHPVTAFFFFATLAMPPISILFVKPDLWFYVLYGTGALGLISILYYFLIAKKTVVEDLVVNMVDVGEETGELDTMLYKVADYYDEEVSTITDGMIKLIEPLMIIFLGLVVLFIVLALFMPLISLIGGLSKSKG